MANAQGEADSSIGRKPAYAAPPGACDAHVHVFNRTAASLSAEVRAKMPYGVPAHAGLDDLLAMHARIGIDRVVVVQTGANGTMDEFAGFLSGLGDRAKGVARIDDTVTDAQLDALERAGVKGCRFNFVKFLHMRPPLDLVARTARRLAPRGWHMCVHLEPDDLLELAGFLESLPIPLVVDHLAHMRCAEGVGHPAFRKLIGWLERDRVWAKIGNSDRWSAAGAPGYGDAAPFLRAAAAANPSKLIWCTDWPHLLYKNPYAPDETLPDCADLVDLLASAIGDEAILKAVLVDNPATLYGF
ncbi:MAG: amidohydrolase family protein [Rhodospirillaceae bacterium]|nr:amidohydrolase family protein [Rhodospirillaceae bacterium]